MKSPKYNSTKVNIRLKTVNIVIIISTFIVVIVGNIKNGIRVNPAPD